MWFNCLFILPNLTFVITKNEIKIKIRKYFLFIKFLFIEEAYDAKREKNHKLH